MDKIYINEDAFEKIVKIGPQKSQEIELELSAALQPGYKIKRATTTGVLRYRRAPALSPRPAADMGLPRSPGGASLIFGETSLRSPRSLTFVSRAPTKRHGPGARPNCMAAMIATFLQFPGTVSTARSCKLYANRG